MTKTETEIKKKTEIYSFQEHNMDNEYIITKHFLNKLEGFSSQEKYPERGKACITYDKDKKKVLDWGEDPGYSPSEGSSHHISNFMDRIHKIYKKCLKTRKARQEKENEEIDKVSDQNKSDQNESGQNENSEDGKNGKNDGNGKNGKNGENGENGENCENCKGGEKDEKDEDSEDEEHDEYEATENDVKNDQTNKADDSDRFKNFAEFACFDEEDKFFLDANQEYAQTNSGSQVFRKGEESILCRVASSENIASIEFDLIAPQYSQLDVSEAILFPRVLQSKKVSLSVDYFKKKVREFIENKMIEKQCEDKVPERIVNFVLNYFSQRKYFYSRGISEYSNYYMFKTTNLTDWQLGDTLTKIIQSIEVNDIFDQIDQIDQTEGVKTITEAIKLVIPNSTKKRTLVLSHRYFSSNEQVPPLVPWLENFLEYRKKSLKYSIVSVTSGYKPTEHISLPNIMAGAATRASQVLRNANVKAVPYELLKDRSQVNRESPSSIFTDKKQNATIFMDISLEETLVTYSSLDDNGNIENICDNSHFKLPPLSKFFYISNGANLKVNKEIISFIDKDLAIDLDYFSKYDRQIKKDETDQPSKHKGNEPDEYFFTQRNQRKDYLTFIIERLLDADSSVEKKLTNTRQQKYIRTFLLIYLSHLNEVILNVKSIVDNSNGKPQVGNPNIGYVISVEKMLLDNLAGTKENFKEIVFASGVVRETDRTKKLKVITRGEELSYVKKNITHDNSDPLSKDKKPISLRCNDTCECRVDLSVRDIIYLAFVPAFKEIATTIFTVIANKDESGNYMNIYCVFGLIYFNRNEKFQKVLANLLKEEVVQCTDGKEIEVRCFVVPELPGQFSQPKIGQRSLLYQEFQVGSLSQVSSETYGFFATYLKGAMEEIDCSYTDNKSGKKVTKMYKNHIFPLLKKGEIIDSFGLNKTFFLDCQNIAEQIAAEQSTAEQSTTKRTITKQTFNIGLYKLKKLDNVKDDERAPKTTNFWDELKNFTLTDYSKRPIMISIRPNVYSPLLDFSVKFVGQDIASKEEYCVKVGESMTIARH
ncbi:hypothetical protein HPULCUR_004704 [Helicostylum pulchrum]|uniref:Uncharacterized protein n=1 Tax=Helicostylum pulchrum TaxID=562976 RepID=A0ABP9XXW2_9FUNG